MYRYIFIHFFIFDVFVFRDVKVVMIDLIGNPSKMKHFDAQQAPILPLNIYKEKRWFVRHQMLFKRR
jgi:hypothetical protein